MPSQRHQNHDTEPNYRHGHYHVHPAKDLVCMICGLTGPVCGRLCLFGRRQDLPDLVKRLLGFRKPNLCLLQLVRGIDHGWTVPLFAFGFDRHPWPGFRERRSALLEGIRTGGDRRDRNEWPSERQRLSLCFINPVHRQLP